MKSNSRRTFLKKSILGTMGAVVASSACAQKIMPGAYPYQAKQEDQRTPHIHMKIGKHGYEPVLTQMYFPDQEQNKTDGLLQRKTKEQQAMMTAQNTEQQNVLLYNIFLEKI